MSIRNDLGCSGGEDVAQRCDTGSGPPSVLPARKWGTLSKNILPGSCLLTPKFSLAVETSSYHCSGADTVCRLMAQRETLVLRRRQLRFDLLGVDAHASRIQQLRAAVWLLVYPQQGRARTEPVPHDSNVLTITGASFSDEGMCEA